MEHINEFRIDRFRGLRDLKIQGLGQINLFVGNNNSGKTSALEALSLFCDPLNVRRWHDTGSQREAIGSLRSSSLDRIIWLFSQSADNAEGGQAQKSGLALSASGMTPIKEVSATYEKFNEIVSMPAVVRPIEGVVESGEVSIGELEEEVEGIKVSVSVAGKYEQAISGKYVQQPLFQDAFQVSDTLTFTDSPFMRQTTKQKQLLALPAQMVNPFTHRTSSLTPMLWSEVVEADLKDETIRLLQHFDPDILDVDFISPTERRQLISIKHAKLGRAPLFTFGDGLRRVFTLATTIPRVRGGFLLIDELETAIHARALERTFAWLVKACLDNQVQLFATTHSLEALDIVTEVSRESANLVVYRLERMNQQTVAKRFDKAMVLQLREELGMELR